MVQVSRDSGVISPSDNGAEEETEDEGEEGGAQEELRVHDTPTITRCGKRSIGEVFTITEKAMRDGRL